jgi:hypothetical protein
MSNEAMTLAWKAADSPDEPGPMWVLIILADHGSDHSGEDFKAFPSVERIMQRSKFKRSTVEAHLKTLVNLGWISRRRRIWPDGRKGVYDYELHRDSGFRATLRAARAAMVEAGLKATGEAADADYPCANSEHGPCSDSETAMREKLDGPCSDPAHHEPPDNPQLTPTPRARDLEAVFRNVEGAYPAKGLGFSNSQAAWAAFCRLADEGVDVEALPAAAAAYANDPILTKRDYGPVRLERWLGEGRYRGWLAGASAPGGVASPLVFAGPAALRTAMLAVEREGLVASYLDPCAWDEATRTLTPRTGTARAWLADCFRKLGAKTEGITLGEPGRTGSGANQLQSGNR